MFIPAINNLNNIWYIRLVISYNNFNGDFFSPFLTLIHVVRARSHNITIIHSFVHPSFVLPWKSGIFSGSADLKKINLMYD